MLFGILSFLVFGIVALTSLPEIAKSMDPMKWKSVQRLGYLAYVFVLLHVAIMGYKGWMNLESYQYGLISISLISAITIVLVLLVRAVAGIFPRKQ